MKVRASQRIFDLPAARHRQFRGGRHRSASIMSGYLHTSVYDEMHVGTLFEF
jgi:hypothetical protein